MRLVLAKFLALLVLAGFSTARLIVFQSQPVSDSSRISKKKGLALK
jgi:hypothetical protein